MSEGTLVNLRLLRLAFVPALLAVVAAMFSLEGPPRALEPLAATATFEGTRAAATARQIVTAAPEREAGSAGDAQAAELIADRFREVRAGTLSRQSFDGSFEGSELELENVVLTLPGELDSSILVIARRDSPNGPGATTSAAASGALAELGAALGVAGHERTFILASTSGEGGAEALIDSLAVLNPVAAVIVLSQPGAAERRQPYVVTSASDAASVSAQLARTAELAVENQVGERPARPSASTQLARLAIPSGLGAQASLIAAGVDAVRISAAGERELEPGEAGVEDLSPANLAAFGRATQATVGALDGAPGPLEHGPATYLDLGENLVPGWALAVLALALILPALVAAIDALARAARRARSRAESPRAGLAFAAVWALPPLGMLGAVYALALVGLLPRPGFAFDPARFPLGPRAAAGLLLIAAAGLVSARLMGRAGIRPARAPAAAGPAAGGLAALACLAAWLANPYLALLLAPLNYAWLAVDVARRPAPRAVAALALGISLAPVLAAVAITAGALELGVDAPWTFALMLAGGQVGLAESLAGCLLLGSLGLSAALLLHASVPGASKKR